MGALADYWNKENLWQMFMPADVGKDFFTQENVNLFYDGYSSPFYTSDMTLYLCTQSGPCRSTQVTKSITWNMNSGKNTRFNILDYAQSSTMGERCNLTVKNMPEKALVICMATGKELNGGSTLKATESINQKYVKEVFIANKKLSDEELGVPEEDQDFSSAKVGKYIGKNGKFYKSEADATRDGTTAEAIVVYYNPKKTVDACGYHGLAMSLTSLGKFEMKTDYYTCMEIANMPDSATLCLRGIGTTKMRGMKLCSHDHRHPADAMAIDKSPINSDDFSTWFVPSAGQWILALEGMGITPEIDFKKHTVNIKNKYEDIKIPLPQGLLDGMCMSSTQASSDQFWSFMLRPGRDISMSKWNMTYETSCIPFVAFDKKDNKDKGFESRQETKVGTVVGSNGKFYRTVFDALDSDINPVAVVVHVDAPGKIEVGTDYTRLAIALTSQNGTWAKNNMNCTGRKIYLQEIDNELNGIALSQKIWEEKLRHLPSRTPCSTRPLQDEIS